LLAVNTSSVDITGGHMSPCSRIRAFAALAVLAGCGGSAPGTGAGARAGATGTTFLVTVVRPSRGTVISVDGQIDCGPAPAARACGPAAYDWNTVAELVATPDAGSMFGTWAGDCTGRQQVGGRYVCLLGTSRAGADKYVVAVFGEEGRAEHPNFTEPATHGREFLDWRAGKPGTFECTYCHGASCDGMGIALSCNGCHAGRGWTAWQTNCSFCHGATSPGARSGYSVTDHPDWSAPPDAVGERLTGDAAPDRTGAHQAHLSGIASDGWNIYAPPLRCETCHAVPTDLGHVRGADARAVVALRGAGQGSLPDDLGAYDAATGTCTTYCHGSTLRDADGAAMAGQAWASPWAPTDLPEVTWHCGTCHGAVVAIPSGYSPSGIFVQVLAPGTGRHRLHDGLGCHECHATTAGEPFYWMPADHVANPANHVNGVKDVSIPSGGAWDAVQGACSTECHGSAEGRQWR
jgi:hypothetical protein